MIELKNYFEKIVKNAIVTDYEPVKSPLPLGSSKFGGNPHLPADFVWPYFEGEGYDEAVKMRPLAFLAQINLEDISAYDRDGLLPHKGFLYFFYEMVSMCWGLDLEEKGCARVFYYGGTAEGLKEWKLPSDMEEEGRIPECSITFHAEPELPSYEELMETCFEYGSKEYDEFFDEYDFDDYDQAVEAFGCHVVEEPETCCKLLGYADVIQGSMVLDCEIVTQQIDIEESELPKEQRRELVENSKEWILLFQMGTVETEDYELMFGDCGCIYFYIRKSDLEQKNFDDIWLELQCY